MSALNHILLAILLTTPDTAPPAIQTQSGSASKAESASEPESAPVLYDTIKYSAQGQGATTYDPSLRLLNRVKSDPGFG